MGNPSVSRANDFSLRRTPSYIAFFVSARRFVLRELFAQGTKSGIEALAVVDRNSLAGVVRAHEAAKTTGVRLIVGCRLDEKLGDRRERHADRYLKPAEEMHRLFGRYPEALARTLEIAERCRFSLDELKYQYPEEHDDPAISVQETLAKLTLEGAERGIRKDCRTKCVFPSTMSCV